MSHSKSLFREVTDQYPAFDEESRSGIDKALAESL